MKVLTVNQLLRGIGAGDLLHLQLLQRVQRRLRLLHQAGIASSSGDGVIPPAPDGCTPKLISREISQLLDLRLDFLKIIFYHLNFSGFLPQWSRSFSLRHLLAAQVASQVVLEIKQNGEFLQ